MPQAVFEYHYGLEAEQYAFFRIPKILMTEPYFKDISTDAKLLYGMMLDRMSLSIKNGWMDENERVYIYFTVEEVCEQFCCHTGKAVKMFNELETENGIGLIQRKKQGQGKPARIYVIRFLGVTESSAGAKEKTRLAKTASQDLRKSKAKTCDNQKSKPAKIESQDLRKSQGNNTDKNNTDFSKTDLSIYPAQPSPMDVMEGYREQIKTNMDYPRNMMLSIDIVPIGMDEAIKMVDKVIMSVDSDANRWQQRQNANNNFTANLPYQMEQMRKVGKEYMDDLTERDQRMMFAVVTLTHLADSLEQLDQDTESLQARTRSCEFSILKYQQEDGLNTVLPYGLRRIEAVRTLTTESTAVLMPFKSQEIQDRGGIYYGVNAVSHNLIICNRGNLLNGNGFILGVSGSGKSMAAKQEFASLALSTDHDLIVVDPEREYGPLVRAMGGEVITISASSAENSYINALDLSSEYGDGKNPLVLKSEFIMSLCEQLMGSGEIGAKEKSIIDRCTANIYREYIKDYKGDPPTLKDLHKDLMMQKEPAAHDIALALELFTTGSLNVFSHQTSINTSNRILCFDIQDLGENLKPIGLLVMLDAIFNRVIRNRREGKFTHVYIDEIYLFFANNSMGSRSNISSYSGEFLYKCWKRFRKYGATLTGITQNVEECLLSDTARMMFANSEFLLMFNQAATDREELSRLLGTSDTQMDYVSDAPAGHGLIKVGGGIVPFINEFPKDTALYWLMTTKPGEE